MVVVAYNEVELALELVQVANVFFPHNIAKMPDFVIGFDHLVPSLGDLGVHLVDGRERPVTFVYQHGVTKVGVGGEEDFHYFYLSGPMVSYSSGLPFFTRIIRACVCVRSALDENCLAKS
jgi:hypothetical protein